MKRPFAVICIACAVVLVLLNMMRGSRRDSLSLSAVKTLMDAADTDQKLTLWGVVDKCSAVSDGLRVYLDHIVILKRNHPETALEADFRLTFTTEDTTLMPEDQVKLYGKIREFDPASNPGQFDIRAWYFSQKTVASISGAKILEKKSGAWTLQRVLCRIRQEFMDSYASILSDQAARTISAISLGEKSWMESEWKDLYQEGGISHILAISGLHVTLIGMSAYQILRKLRRSFFTSALVSGIILVLYALLTGAGVSAVRAAVMFGMWLGAQVSGRKNDMLTSTAAAALILTLSDAGNPGQSSFILSFGAVLSMGILLPCLMEAFSVGGRQPGPVLSALLSSLAIWIGTLPCTLYFFYQAVPWSMLINLLVIPLMSSLMSFGLLSAFAGMVWLPLGIFLAAPVEYILQFFQWLCEQEQKLPLAVWVLGRPAVWRMIVYYSVLFLSMFVSRFLRKKEKIKVSAALWAACFGVGLMLMAWRTPTDLTVTCLDVGQGDCALVQLPTGESCLIDGGSSSKTGLWEYIISQTVKYYGISSIDYIFLSHADQDHTSGILEFLTAYTPGFGQKNAHGVSIGGIVLPPVSESEDFQDLKELAGQNQIPVLQMAAGDSLGVGTRRGLSCTFTCLAPDADQLLGERNQDSMVLRLCYGEFSMLFTGDLEKEGEQRLALSGQALRSDVLKVGHHGSAGASSEAFLSRVCPKISVISCGINNRYGHPAPETVERLEETGCRIFQTPVCGAVTVQSDGDRFVILPYAGRY